MRFEMPQTPTSAENAAERFETLMSLVTQRLQQRREVDSVLSREDAMHIRRLLNKDKAAEAAPLIDRAFKGFQALVAREPEAKFERSPFGYLWSGVDGRTWQERYGDAVNIGVRWHRGGTSVIGWPRVQRGQEAVNRGLFDWEEHDREFLLLTQANLHIVANFDSEGRRDPREPHGLKDGSWLPINEDAYFHFVKTAVERYDGDGVDDAPGDIRIKHWQVDNEPNFDPRRSPESYAEFLKKMHATIKEADPEARILMAGCGGPGWELNRIDLFGGRETLPYYKRILSALKGERCFDIFDWHYYGNATGDYRRLEGAFPILRRTLDKHGYENVPIWITEMTTHSGVLGDDPNTFQNEEMQATDLVKRYVFPLALGVEKVFWCVGMMELGGDGPFGNTGLIYDGRGSGDKGRGVRKLAYYSYKLMTEKLKGKQFVGEVTGLPVNVYAYRFGREADTVTVVWWDWFSDPEYQKGQTKEVVLPVSGSARVRVISAVTDSDGERRTRLLEGEDGKVVLDLGVGPLFIEFDLRKQLRPRPNQSGPQRPERRNLLADLPEDLVVEQDIAYGKGPNARYQTLDIIHHKDKSRRRPAIVMIHGGAFKGGDKRSYHGQMREYAQQGYVTLSINYRLSQVAHFPAAVADCKLAIRWLRAHAEQYGVDPERIGATGGSSGGYLTAMVALTDASDGLEGDGPYQDQSSRVQAAVPCCSAYDWRAGRVAKLGMREDDPVHIDFLGGPPTEIPELYEKASPVVYISKGDPPLLIFHGKEDRVVNVLQATAFGEALKKAGANYELIVVEGAGHGGGLMRANGNDRRMATFFAKHLKPDTASETKTVKNASVGRADERSKAVDSAFGIFGAYAQEYP